MRALRGNSPGVRNGSRPNNLLRAIDLLVVAGGSEGAENTIGRGGEALAFPGEQIAIGPYTVTVAPASVGPGNSQNSSFGTRVARKGERSVTNWTALVNNYRTGSNVTYGSNGPNDQSETPGGANTGNGGSSSALGSGVFVDGGSGIVVVRYPTGSMTATGGTITTYGGFTVHTFLTSGTFTRVT